MKIIISKWFERIFLTACFVLIILLSAASLAVGSFIFAQVYKELL